LAGDPVRGLNFVDVLALFQDDLGRRHLMVGEIGGSDEEAGAEFVRQHVTKQWSPTSPAVHCTAGQAHGPCRSGDCGGKGTAADKYAALERAGVAGGAIAGGTRQAMAAALARQPRRAAAAKKAVRAARGAQIRAASQSARRAAGAAPDRGVAEPRDGAPSASRPSVRAMTGKTCDCCSRSTTSSSATSRARRARRRGGARRWLRPAPDLVLLPELTLSSYPPEDLLFIPAFRRQVGTRSSACARTAVQSTC